jgi:hypothetical protein
MMQTPDSKQPTTIEKSPIDELYEFKAPKVNKITTIELLILFFVRE